LKGIIFVLHGRRTGSVGVNLQLIDSICQAIKLPASLGLLEGNQHTLEQAVEELQQQNVSAIIFVPVLLFPATHVQKDLPHRVKNCLKDQLPYQILAPLGTTQAVEDFLVMQSRRTAKKTILLIAHGTPHDEASYQQLEQIAKKVAQRTAKTIIPTQYLGSHPYQRVLKNQPACGIQRLFLTEGAIANKIKAEIVAIRGNQDDFLATLENSAELKQAILERLEQSDVSDFN